jgi:hypothetical protein
MGRLFILSCALSSIVLVFQRSDVTVSPYLSWSVNNNATLFIVDYMSHQESHLDFFPSETISFSRMLKTVVRLDPVPISSGLKCTTDD